ncbi:hypothetical protein [Reichenbachiella ulvae]|uniref:Uncharacterized protein n=1 Tax=Reichenbachiella ulvae TaxID=2980104 RepID=A0ABT3CUG6_9BACT|nr:hypothetical protein [Reichenbachiella ulvae]MCV9387159.1 hypothetical protein [Reichenbachiella ulvae]
MQKFILTLSLAACCQLALAQDFNQIANYKFQSAEDFKTQEPTIIQCAEFLLGTPASQQEPQRLLAIQFILKWMEGTPDYTFEIGPEAAELTKGNTELLSLFLASMSKVVLENNGSSLTNAEVYQLSETMVVDYCADENNKVKPSKKIKQLLKSQKT